MGVELPIMNLYKYMFGKSKKKNVPVDCFYVALWNGKPDSVFIDKEKALLTCAKREVDFPDSDHCIIAVKEIRRFGAMADVSEVEIEYD